MDNSEVFHDAFVKMINFAKEHLSKGQFGEYIYLMYVHGVKNVFIEEVPVYKNVEYNGCVLYKYIDGMRYVVKCDVKHDAMPRETGTKEV